MASETRIVVEIADLVLDDRRDVLKLLTEATAEDQVQWTVQEVEREPDQGGVVEIVFVAVTTKVVEQLVVKAEAVVGPWCRRRMNEVWHRIRTEPVEAGTDVGVGLDPGPDTSADTSPDARTGAAKPAAGSEAGED
ncbi:MAG: hypothetical protein HOV83_06990 [Catenulispora sp.]|nr:hypothetical protein [Catenulispora sp.]